MTKSKLQERFAGVPERLAKFAMEHGYRDPDHLANLLVGLEDGLEVIASETGLSKNAILTACGFDKRPEFSGVTLHAPCHVGGVLQPEETGAESGNARASPRVSLPDNACLIPRFGPPRSQGPIGSCTAFAATAMLECAFGNSIDLAERLVYWVTKTIDGKPDTDGSFLRFASQALVEYGACLESTWPYVEDRAALKERPSEAAFREATEYLPTERSMLAARDVYSIKAEIADGRAVGLSLPIYKSHYANLRFHSEGRWTLPFLTDRISGGHAVCAVAYLDDSWLEAEGFEPELGGGAFLIRNSWGEGWAKSNELAKHFGASCGYGIVPYRYIEQQCWEAVSVTCPSTAAKYQRRIRNGAVSMGRTIANHGFQKVVAGACQRLYGSKATSTRRED